jgi:hypothetical protein
MRRCAARLRWSPTAVRAGLAEHDHVGHRFGQLTELPGKAVHCRRANAVSSALYGAIRWVPLIGAGTHRRRGSDVSDGVARWVRGGRGLADAWVAEE